VTASARRVMIAVPFSVALSVGLAVSLTVAGCASAPLDAAHLRTLSDRRVCTLALTEAGSAIARTLAQQEQRERALSDQRCGELVSAPAPAAPAGMIMRGSRSGT